MGSGSVDTGLQRTVDGIWKSPLRQRPCGVEDKNSSRHGELERAKGGSDFPQGAEAKGATGPGPRG